MIRIASEVMKMGKCVVIGLQSTGEARTLEAVEREEELTDFVSTAKGVLQVLHPVSKYLVTTLDNYVYQLSAVK